MGYPKYISRTSLALLVLVSGSGHLPPGEYRGRAVPVKPSATVMVELEAPIYDGRLQNRTDLLRAVSDTFLSLLDSAYRYVEWLPSSSASAQDTVVVQVYHDVNTVDDVVLRFTIQGAHARSDHTLAVSFESVAEVWERTDWTDASVVSHWVSRIHEVAKRESIQLVHNVFVHLPLAAQPQIRNLQATIPFGPKDISADSVFAPEFKLHATVIATAPVTTQDPADLYLSRCRSGPAVYVCHTRLAVFLGDTLQGPELVQELTAPNLTIHPTALHVWSYAPDRDPRPNGMIAPGGTP